MAIPDWTWAGDDDVLAGQSLPSGALDPVSETFGALSDPARLEILVALARGETPMAYSTLRAATNVQDKGRFNYRVRQLRGEFIQRTDDGYVLTDGGRAFLRTVLTDADLARNRRRRPRCPGRRGRGAAPAPWISGLWW